MELRNRNIGQVPPRGNVRLGERLHGVEEPLPGEDRIAGAIDRNQDVYVQPDIGNGDGDIGGNGDNKTFAL